MSKRRTKEEKIRANYSFIFNSNAIRFAKENVVKSHLKLNKVDGIKEAKMQKKGLNKELENNLNYIKKDIIKTLILTTLILSLEIVLYFAWKKL